MRNEITNEEVHMARMVLSTMDNGQTEIPEDVKADIKKYGVFEVSVIKHLVERMLTEGKLPEEKHRYQAEGAYKQWAGDSQETMPDEVLNEFTVNEDGIVQITEEEFRDVLAYIAREYYG